MSKDEIADLRVEAGLDPAEQDQPQAADPPPPESPAPVVVEPITREQLGKLMAQVAVGIGRPLCARARVTEISKEEADTIGLALADLMIVYNWNRIEDPRVAAWIGVGVSVVGVIGNRRRLAPPSDTREPESPAPSDDASNYGKAPGFAG